MLLVAVSATFIYDFIFSKKMDLLESELSALVVIMDTASEKELLEKTENIVLNWDKSSGMLRSIVLHNGIDELGRLLSSLPQIIEYSDRNELKLTCIEAMNMIKNLKECEKIHIDNIL